MSRNHMWTRRSLLAAAGAGTVLTPAHAESGRVKIGVTDWNLSKGANPESVALAASIGFDGVEISFGRKVSDGKLPLDRPSIIAQYQDAFKRHGISIAGTCLDILHVNCLMNDKLAQQWVADGIRLSRQLGAKVMLLPFFGNCEMKTLEQMDGAAAALKDLAREAEKADVTLGLENTISAEHSVRIAERVGSRAVKVYYDAANALNWGHDPYKEIRWLGAKRICQIHIKDNPNYLGEGRLRWPELIQTIGDIGYEGFANLETSSPSKSIENDMKRNLAYVRKWMNTPSGG